MSLINILREPDSNGLRVPDQVEDTLLVKTEGETENENERVTFVEYRFPNSDVIVHRSCHLTLKKMPIDMSGIAQPLI